ncbi:MAG: AAA family ATPase [Syntrophomonadaceae bacterium]|nr:AAA family ATPase [Syntrophomonadaceae bacterium]
MIDLLKDIEIWFKGRPKWLQDAARRIIQNSEITIEDIKELTELCKAEAGIVVSTIKPLGIPAGSLTLNENNISLRLNSISNITGINALSPRKPLNFSAGPITIVYGQNGSGKSGYVRILKHACGSRKPGKLLSNVFNNANIKQSCTFNVTTEMSTKDIDWVPELGVLDELRPIELFDSDCANVYINDENEVTYEPWILSLFSQLTDACDKVGQSIKEDVAKQVSKKPKLPESYVTTVAGIWYEGLTYKTKDINMKCIWPDELEHKLIELRKRLSEVNPADKAKKLRKTKTSAETFNARLKSLKDNYSDEKCANLLSSKNDASIKRKAADEDVKKVFDGVPLEGVGTETWKLLWQSARNYSENVAYPGKAFPNTELNAKCVLCLQPLCEEAKQRLISFEEFVKGELQKKARNAEQKLKTMTDALVDIPTTEQLNLLMDSAGLLNDAERSQIKGFCEGFEKRKNTLINAKDKREISPLPSEEKIDFITIWITTIEQQASLLEEDAKGENRADLIKRLNELEAQKWLFQQKQSIDVEVQRLILVQNLKKAQGLTNTTQISSKKSSLSDVLISNEYLKRFSQELKALGASKIKVEMIKTRASKGRIYHQIGLKNCSKGVTSAEVLSEGEFRVVSLAGFLADVQGRSYSTPFVFDDPISSLDQDFEEATVNRIVKLCDIRQVIVFTHRLSMVALLEEAIKKVGLKYEVLCLRNENWGIGEPGDTPIFAKKPDKAFNSLLNERLAKAKKAFDEEGSEAYEIIAKGICSDFRILIERLIENDLLADVVQRFRRSINTMGKIHKLALINREDCQLFDDFMTKYSRYEHSQSYETPVELPEPDELKADIERIQTWTQEFNKRHAS